MRPRVALAVAGIALAVLGGCGGTDGDDGAAATTTSGASDTPANTVVLKAVKFTPERIAIGKGETVTWEWDDPNVPHDVAGEGFKSEIKDSGTFEHTFDETGTFEYKCTVHPTMTGSVEVTE